MLTSIDAKFIFDSARLWLFSSANILQLTDVAVRVVYLLFLPCFFSLPIISPSSYSWNEWGVRHFCFYNQNNSTSSQVFSVNGALTCKKAELLTSSVV